MSSGENESATPTADSGLTKFESTQVAGIVVVETEFPPATITPQHAGTSIGSSNSTPAEYFTIERKGKTPSRKKKLGKKRKTKKRILQLWCHL